MAVFCSLSAHRGAGGKNGHFYAGTKFAVRALLEGMRNELREMNSNIRVAVSIYISFFYIKTILAFSE